MECKIKLKNMDYFNEIKKCNSKMKFKKENKKNIHIDAV